MAARKQFLDTGGTDPELVKLLEDHAMEEATEEELREQRISFAYGNAPADATLITKDSVRATAACYYLICMRQGKLLKGKRLFPSAYAKTARPTMTPSEQRTVSGQPVISTYQT